MQEAAAISGWWGKTCVPPAMVLPIVTPLYSTPVVAVAIYSLLHLNLNPRPANVKKRAEIAPIPAPVL